MTLRDLYQEKFVPRWNEIERVTGSRRLKEMLEAGHSAETVLVLVHEKAQEFETARKPYLLYEPKAEEK
jgi:uncharacterized protein YbbC (DUF1343 family)